MREWDDTVPADDATRRPQAIQRTERRGNADRAAGVAPPSDCGKGRRYRCPCASARSARAPPRIVGIARLATHRADTRYAGGEFVQVGLADDDRPRIAQPPDDERILARR